MFSIKKKIREFRNWIKKLLTYSLDKASNLGVRKVHTKSGVVVKREVSDIDLDALDKPGLLERMSMAKAPRGGFSLSPGDIVSFFYNIEDSGWRVVFIVSNKRGPSGKFISTRNNLLNSCYRIDNISPETLEVILKVLYKNRKRSDYYKLLPFFENVFGKRWGQYRTYNMAKISSYYEIYYKP